MPEHPQRPPARDPGPKAYTMVKARCPGCATVRFPIAAAALHIDPSTRAAHVSFLCPGCGFRVAQRVTDDDAVSLRDAGVPVRPLTRPAEADEPHDGPALTEYDLIVFAAALHGPGWLAELTG